MYERFFCLHEPAFSMTPDPRFLWLSEKHEEALAAICYGIGFRKGLVLLTGAAGSGKTILLRSALRRIPQDILDVPATALLTNTLGLSSLDLLKLITAEFAIEGRMSTRADYVMALNSFLAERHRGGLTSVLVIEEAQNLGHEGFEQVRLLSNLESDSEKLLQIVLSGQAELRDKLGFPGLEPLRQRVTIEHHVDPLQPDEVLPYLRHRLEVAGGRYQDVFGTDADRVFAAFSVGIPRLINLLADRVLLAAYGRQLRPVPASFVAARAREIAAERAATPPKSEEAEEPGNG